MNMRPITVILCLNGTRIIARLKDLNKLLDLRCNYPGRKVLTGASWPDGLYEVVERQSMGSAETRKEVSLERLVSETG